jgi:hypothetical protein
MYGARGDGRVYKGVAITNGTATLVSSGAAFTIADVGKAIWVQYAAGGSAPLKTTVTGFVSTTSVTLAANASTTVSNSAAIVKIGTDDTAALDLFALALSTGTGRSGFVPHGTYLYSGTSGIILGNGTAAAPSTSQSIEIIGEVGSTYNFLSNTVQQGTAIEYFGAGVATCMLDARVARIRIENLLCVGSYRVQTVWNFKHTFWSRAEMSGAMFPQAGGKAFMLGAYYNAAGIFIGAGGNVFEQCVFITTGALSCDAIQVGEDAFVAGFDVATTRFNNCYFAVSDDTNAASWAAFNPVPTATTSACVKLRFTDNISFEGCFFFVSGERRGFNTLIMPPSGSGNAGVFPTQVLQSGCHHVGAYWVDETDNDWNPDPGDGVLRGLFIDCGHFGDASDPNYDGAVNPPDIYGIAGFTDAGEEFGLFKYRKTDVAGHRSVISATTTAQPGSPTAEDIYIIPASATGTPWSTYAVGSFAQYRGGRWAEIVPQEGFTAYVEDLDFELRWNGTAWKPTVQVLGRDVAPATVSNSVAATALATISVKGRVLGTDGKLRIRGSGLYLNNTVGAANFTLAVSYGGSNILLSPAISATNNAGFRAVAFDCEMAIINGNTATQASRSALFWGAPASGGSTAAIVTATYNQARDGMTVTSTSDQDVVVTATHGTADANISFKLNEITVELL